MNAWPAISEWCRFGIVLALELLVVFAAAKLIVWRLKSAHWRRALWQSALIAMVLITLGELNDVRGLFRSKPLSEESTKPQRALIVTIKDPDASMLPLEPATLPSMAFPADATIPIEQRRAAWPAWIWLSGLALLLCRVSLANIFTLTFRRPSQRVQQADLNERTQSLANTLGIQRPVILAQSERAIAPFTFGVLKPVIVLPKNFADAFTPEQRDVALAHELAHVANFDSLWRAFSQFVCALLWWHPAVWLTKRELDHASELVADESSLLIADGPNRLAECLVQCANELQKPALVTWLGMDGGGFRSALGKRVARLLQLQSAGGVTGSLPWYVRILAPATFACLLWLIAALLESPQANQNGWHGSIIGNALARAAENPPAAIAQGRSAQLQTNNTASIGSIAGLDTSTNAHVVNAEQKAVSEKLKQIRFSEFGPIDNLPLSEVIRSLSDEARRRDPEKKGVNFFLTSKGNRQPGTDEPFDINATTIRLGTMLRNITLEQALRIVIDAAERPIKISIEDYGVLITPDFGVSANLHTRFFKVEPSALAYNLDAIERANGSRQRVTASNLTSVLDALKRQFTKAGVDLQRPGTALFYTESQKSLMVKAPEDELETVENVVQIMNSRPPQLVLKIKAVEVSLSSSNAMWEWFLRGTLKTNTSSGNKPAETTVTGILTEPQFRAVRRDLEKRGGTDLLTAPDVTTLSGRQAQIKVVDIRYIVTDLNVDSAADKPSRKGATNITTGAKTNSSSVVTPFAQPFELGPVVDVTPTVQADGYSIFLSVQPSLREFLGYEDPGTFAAEVDDGKGEVLKTPVPLPKFRLRKAAVSAVVWDGQTLVINAGPSRHEERERKPDGTFTTNYTDKALFFFVTPTLIDPAGNRLHSDAEVLSKATGR